MRRARWFFQTMPAISTTDSKIYAKISAVGLGKHHSFVAFFQSKAASCACVLGVCACPHTKRVCADTFIQFTCFFLNLPIA